MVVRICRWVPVGLYNLAYNTKCKQEIFLLGLSKENKYKFCPYCGGKLVVGKKVKE